MEKYLKKLIQQFKAATGTVYADINSPSFISEFSHWIKTRKLMGKEYSSFIEYMGVFSEENIKSSAEIEKGRHDTIVIGTGIPMITPYSVGTKRSDGRVINADFEVYDGKPMITCCAKGNNQIKFINTSYIRNFLTHNPYEESCIRNWEQIHNTGANIVVGVFGSIYDKDIEPKIRQIEALRDRLVDDRFIEDYTVIGDNYYYVVSSLEEENKLVKKKTLTR